jgi:DNA-binding NarL/FixJ family response regulator
VSAAPELLEVMPLVSRALKRGDDVRAERLLGQVLADNALGRRAVSELTGRRADVAVPTYRGPLTRSQWIVLWAAACGLTAAETARLYHRGVETVKTHKLDAYRALGIPRNETTIAGAVASCYRRGIFDRNDPLEPVPLSEW